MMWKSMQKKALLICFVSIFLTSQAFGDFKEGSIDLMMQTPQGDVDVKLKISPKAVRSELQMSLGQIKMDMTFLIKLLKNAQMFQINDAAKTYTPIDLPSGNSSKSANGQTSHKDIKVKKIGDGKILGYKVNHLSLKGDDFTGEVWVSPKIGLFSTLKKLQQINKNSNVQQDIFNVLESKNHKGFPLKMWWQEKGGVRMKMEVTRIKKENLPSSLFEIPKGYTKEVGGGLTSPQTVNNIKNILENMTPQQKEALKKMMQGQGGAPTK